MKAEHILVEGASSSGTELKRAEVLFSEFKDAGPTKRLELLDQLGPLISNILVSRFKLVLSHTDLPEKIEVDGWTHDAVRVLIQHCAEHSISITIQNGSRFITPVVWPSTGLLLEVFVNSLISGSWE